MTRARRAMLGNLLFVAIIASGVAWLLYRQDLVAHKADQPYTTMRILPDSLTQRPIADSSHWGLFYSIETLKRESCDEILVERFIHRIGETDQIAANRDISGEIVAAADTERVTHGLHVRLAKPLGHGDYFLLLRSTCYVAGDDGIKNALSPAAEAFVCFRVPQVMARSEEVQRLQPVSENCRRELSQAIVRPWHYRLANGR